MGRILAALVIAVTVCVLPSLRELAKLTHLSYFLYGFSKTGKIIGKHSYNILYLLTVMKKVCRARLPPCSPHPPPRPRALPGTFVCAPSLTAPSSPRVAGGSLNSRTHTSSCRIDRMHEPGLTPFDIPVPHTPSPPPLSPL
jgi:hypothetical protein